MTSPLPFILDLVVLAVGLVVLLLEAFDEDKNKNFIGWLCTICIGVIFVLSFFSNPVEISPNSQLANFYTADSFALFFKRIALGTTFLVLLLSLEYRPILAKFIPSAGGNAGVGEFFALPIFTCAGLMWMASAIDFTMIFVSLELVTISFYILVTYMRRSAASLEAGVKYLILGALSTGFLVYGITWIFGVTGQTNLAAISEVVKQLPAEFKTPLLFGISLVLVGLGFKIAAAPFQLWVPDVYQGAPTPITAFLSVGSKAAGFIVLMRVLQPFLGVPGIHEKLILVLTGLAVLTLIYGNFAAMPQKNLKRLLAYSSIAHAGYLLVSLASWNHTGLSPVTISFYLAGYLLMTLLSFLVIIVINNNTGGDDIANFNGLAQRSPILAFGMLVSMLSLAGVPFTAGFLGKFFVFRDAVAANQWLLVAVGVITVATGFYYYLKVIRAMYWNSNSDMSVIPVSNLTKTTIAALSFLIFFFGVFPQPLLAFLTTTAR